MKIILNANPYQHRGNGTLDALIREMEADPDQVAVAINEDVIVRSQRDSARLKEGDHVDVLTLVAGG